MLPLVVVAGKGPSLGRDWLKHLRLDWPSMSCSANHSAADPGSTHKPELGTLRGYEASIYVDPTVAPKFCKARSVPYAFHPELDQLVAVGVLEPVRFQIGQHPLFLCSKGTRKLFG